MIPQPRQSHRRTRQFKNTLVAGGLLAGLAAGTGAGLVLQSTGTAGASSSVIVDDTTDDTTTDDTTADTTTDDTTTDDTTTDDTTADTTTTDTDRAAERSARLTEILQPLVDDGTITADQAAAVVAALDAAGPVGGRGGGHGGRGGGMGRGAGVEAAAEALGLTTDELRTELSSGLTLAEIATAEGVDVQTVIDALVAEAETHLAEHVAAGDLTQAEADAKLAEATTRITEQVNEGGGFGRGGRGDRDGGATSDADADA